MLILRRQDGPVAFVVYPKPGDMVLLKLTRARRTSATGDLLLDVASLELSVGQRVALKGPSGSGKSVLLRSLAWLDPLDSGGLSFCGTELKPEDVAQFRSRCVYLHQHPWLSSGSVEQNLRAPFELACHRGREFDRPRVVDWLVLLGRDESFLGKPGTRLSGGERQLAALLRAVQLDPQVLLLDEPTSGLDADACQWIEALVLDWCAADASRALVWTSHDAEQQERVSNAVWNIRQGHLEEWTP